MRLCSCCVLVLLALPVSGAYIACPTPDKVVPHASHVVFAELDHKRQTAKIRREYRGQVGAETIVVQNLRIWGKVGEPWAQKKDAVFPKRAWLFLDQLDGRFHLVARSSPFWIPAHSAIVYEHDGVAHAYAQLINPGGLNLIAFKYERKAFEAQLRKWLAVPHIDPGFRPALAAADAERFYATIEPHLDYHLRRLANKPPDLPSYLDRLVAYTNGAKGEAQRRGLEALLMLAHQNGPDQARATLVTRRFRNAVRKWPRRMVVKTLFDELRSTDVYASKECAVRILRTYPEIVRIKARDVLVAMVKTTKDASLATRAYWALVYLGYRDAGDRARAAR